MAAIKAKQWDIDRAYNMSLANAERTIKLLSCIDEIEQGILSKEEGLNKAVSLGVITTPDRYERSTATVLKAYGLLKSTFAITDVARAYINKKIDFQEMMILQLIKKEHKYDESSEVIRPFIILLKVLNLLKQENESECWIDCYDYQEHLTEIRKNSDVYQIAMNILNDRNKTSRTPKYIINHFDIWINAFLSTGLIEEIEFSKDNIYKRYTLSPNSMEFISFLIENDDKLPIIEEYNRKGNRTERLEKYGSMNNGLFSIMPNVELEDEVIINGLEFNEKKLLESYLINGDTYRKIESEMFGDWNLVDTKGFVSKWLLKSFGINSKHKGIWSPFINYKHFIELNEKYKNLNKIMNILFGGDEMNNSYRENRCINGFNKIYYGIPGCGKSFKISSALAYKDGFEQDSISLRVSAPVAQENIFRTTFYLDYTNSDFVGQIMPSVKNNNVIYEPILGPFTKALKRSLETDDMVYLVIEEINRGNAAAIFGDIFQLLDRHDKNLDLKGSKVGDSRYPITNTFIENALNLEKGNVIIPSNLSIIATMNTSDQGVFPLDTAFKRRWELERVVDDDKEYSIDEMIVPFTEYSWKDFRRIINGTIQKKSKDGTISVDKQLGRWFAKEDMLTTNENVYNRKALNKFVNNVLDYLYSDVCKFDKSDFFDEDMTLDDICRIIDSYQDDKIYDLELKILEEDEENR